jgi:hypothetical protein
MTEQFVATEHKVSSRRTRSYIFKIGFWGASAAFVSSSVYDLSFLLSVSNFVSPVQNSIIGYGSSLIIATPFLLAVVVMHYTVPEEKFWTNAALVLAVIYTTGRKQTEAFSRSTFRRIGSIRYPLPSRLGHSKASCYR